MTRKMDAVVVSAAVFCACACIGADVSWRGGDGDWFDAAKWSTDAVPAAGDTVTVSGGTVTLTGVTERVSSLALSGAGAVLVFAEPRRAAPPDLVTTLHADSIVLSGGATVTHAANDMTVADYLALADESRAWLMDARVNIVCGTLLIDQDSQIDADGKGYHLEAEATKCGAPGPGGDTTNVTGTVGIAWDNGTAAAYLCAGGHGGWGAGTHWRVIDKKHELAYSYGRTYGDPAAPVWCGSAGDSGTSASFPGTAGGGAVRIAATGTVTIVGAITANGAGPRFTETDQRHFSGSGGSVWIAAGAVAGSGLVSADGGAGYTCRYAGGGGRVAVTYDAALQDALGAVPALAFSADSPASPESFGSATPARSFGEVGTVFFTDDRFFTEVFDGVHGVRAGELRAAEWGRWSPAFLAVTNARIRFAEGAATNLTLAGGVTVSGAAAQLDLGGGDWYFDTGATGQTPYVRPLSEGNPVLRAASFTVADGARFALVPGHTNGTALVALAGDLAVGANASIRYWCHPTNGAVARITASNAQIAATATLDASGTGYTCASSGASRGPGRFPREYGFTGAAVGHGGAGSGLMVNRYIRSHMGSAYDTPDEPFSPGTSGDGVKSDGISGTSGGGVVWLECAGMLAFDGTADANGMDACYGSTGTGSGGSVYLKATAVTGSGRLLAAGGYNGARVGRGVFGAGGRIAVVYDPETQSAVETQPTFHCSAACRDTDAFFATNALNKSPYYQYVHAANMGSVYFTDGSFLPGTFTAANFPAAEIHLGDWSTYRPAQLTVNGARVYLAMDGQQLDVAGNLLVTNAGVLGFGGGAFNKENSLRQLPYSPGNGPVVRIGGDAVVTGTSELHVFCGTNSLVDGLGAFVDIAGAFVLRGAGNALYPVSHPFTGCSARFRARSFALETNSVIDATARGYSGMHGKFTVIGYGPGASLGASAASYGGRGAAKTVGEARPTYPADEESGRQHPRYPGSGSGGNSNAPEISGAPGGGLVWIEAEREMAIAGRIWAPGFAGHVFTSGASGGGVLLRCWKWKPSETMEIIAPGGGAPGASGYAGGGGRIAVWRCYDGDPRPATVEGRPEVRASGTLYGSYGFTTGTGAEAGTVYWGDLPPRGLTIYVR